MHAHWIDNVESVELTRALAEEAARIADENTQVTKGMMEAAIARQFESIKELFYHTISSISQSIASSSSTGTPLKQLKEISDLVPEDSIGNVQLDVHTIW